MQSKRWVFAMAMSLMAASSASAQVVSGVIAINGAEMR